MSFLDKFKKPAPEFPPEDEHQDEVNLDPQTKPVRRLNGLIIAGIGVLLIGSLGYAFFSGNSSSTSSKKQQDEQRIASDVLTDEGMKQADRDAKKKAAASKNGSAAKGNTKASAQGANGASPASAPEGFHIDERGNTVRDNPSSDSRSSSRSGSSSRSYSDDSGSSGSYSGSSSGSSSRGSAPAPLTPYEKYQKDSEAAQYKRQLQQEQAAYSQERKGESSRSIFFTFGDDKPESSYKDSLDRAHGDTPNDYYNDYSEGASASRSRSGDDDYIAVVDSGSSRSRRSGRR